MTEGRKLRKRRFNLRMTVYRWNELHPLGTPLLAHEYLDVSPLDSRVSRNRPSLVDLSLHIGHYVLY
jgi:hypothetical protein